MNTKIIDTHVHLWDPDILGYPWFKDIPLLNRPYLLEDYRKAIEGIGIEKVVFAQAECNPSQYLNEVQWVTDLASKDPIINGIISWAPMEKGESVRDELDKLYENKLVKGIRRIIEFETDIDFCIQPDFIDSVKLLSIYDFSFDICINHIQLENTIKFVKQCPEVNFILDHIGKPDIKNHITQPWKSEIKKLSLMPNVSCKISGLVNEAKYYEWKKQDLKPYILHIVECFGIDRLIYGGDWPVMLIASQDYRRWFDVLEGILKGEFTDHELHRLYFKNAERIYKL